MGGYSSSSHWEQRYCLLFSFFFFYYSDCSLPVSAPIQCDSRVVRKRYYCLWDTIEYMLCHICKYKNTQKATWHQPTPPFCSQDNTSLLLIRTNFCLHNELQGRWRQTASWDDRAGVDQTSYLLPNCIKFPEAIRRTRVVGVGWMTGRPDRGKWSLSCHPRGQGHGSRPKLRPV